MMLIAGHHKTATQWLIRIMLCLAQSSNWRFSASHISSHWGQGLDLDCFFNPNAHHAFFPFDAGPSVHIIRNPLDMLVSSYFSHRNTHSTDGWPELGAHRQNLRAVGKIEGYQLQYDYMFSPNFKLSDGELEVVAPFAALKSWDFKDNRFLTVKMEELTAEPEFWLLRMFEHCNVNAPNGLTEAIAFSTFEKISGGRKTGTLDENSHYRSGIAGAWRTELPTQIIDKMRVQFSQLLGQFYRDCI